MTTQLKVFGLLIPIVAALMLSGCNSKESLLVPGQSESDCSDKASKLGVCGSPKSIFEHQDRIKGIYYEEGESYRVDKSGRIFNIDSGDEVIPGVKPDDCGTSVCPGCENDNKNTGCSQAASSNISLSSGGSNGIALSNRALVVDTPQKSSVIRDMGWQQKVWIAPHENSTGDLVEAHGIYVVIQEPKWIIGEREPQKTKKGAVVPTPLAAEVLTDNHVSTNRNTQNNIDQYLRAELKKNIENIDNFVVSKPDNKTNAAQINKSENARPKPIFKPNTKAIMEVSEKKQELPLLKTNNGDEK